MTAMRSASHKFSSHLVLYTFSVIVIVHQQCHAVDTGCGISTANKLQTTEKGMPKCEP